MSLLMNGECSICGNKLNETDDLVTTNCNHIFHRVCAQERFDKKNRTDCHICQQESTLGNALSQNSSTTTQRPTEQNVSWF